MKTYVATKIVRGEPMSENDFKVHHRGEGPAGLSDAMDQEGYLVVYPDGYRSWSPKEAFDNSHREIFPNEYELIKEGL